MENGLPCLDTLEATPEILRLLMAGLSAEDACRKPSPNEFSVAEVIAHLLLSESHCYRARLDRILAEDRPQVAGDDASMHYDEYRDRDPEEDFAHFEEQRESNIEFLRELDAADGERKGVHDSLGEFTLNAMLHEWAAHDLGHIRQIAGLVKRVMLEGAHPWTE